jgi:hypothetical protein
MYHIQPFAPMTCSFENQEGATGWTTPLPLRRQAGRPPPPPHSPPSGAAAIESSRFGGAGWLGHGRRRRWVHSRVSGPRLSEALSDRAGSGWWRPCPAHIQRQHPSSTTPWFFYEGVPISSTCRSAWIWLPLPVPFVLLKRHIVGTTVDGSSKLRLEIYVPSKPARERPPSYKDALLGFPDCGPVPLLLKSGHEGTTSHARC